MVRTVSPAEVPQHLSAADAAILLVRPSFSKRASSPTKYGECLAAGLPLVISREIGDGAEIERRSGAVSLDHAFSETSAVAAVSGLNELLARPRAHFARIGTELFDIDTVALPAYSRLYRKIASEGHA